MDRRCGLVVFFLGVAILWQGKNLAFGRLSAPGPGFVPVLLAVLLLILSLFLILPQEKKETNEPVFTSSMYRALLVFIAMLIYSFTLEYVGFLVDTFLLMSLLFASAAPRLWHRAVLWSFVCTGFSYLLFGIILKSNLPKGVFWF